jgi:hypothetical protein
VYDRKKKKVRVYYQNGSSHLRSLIHIYYLQRTKNNNNT